MNGWYGRCYTICIVALVLLCCSVGIGHAATVEIEIGAVAVAEGDASSPARHLARFDLPAYLSEAEIELAVVEFSADVECDAADGSLMLNAYFMTEDWEAGIVDWSSLTGGEDEPYDRSRHAMWCVAAGDAMLVRLDVTEMVSAWAEDPASNRGLVLVPSLSEEATIIPALAGSGRGGEARLTVWYTPRAVSVEPDVGGLR